MRIGLHLSTAGGLLKAVEAAAGLGLGCLQIFAGSPRMWRRTPPDPGQAKAFCDAAARAGLDPLVIHAPYLINLATPDEQLWRRSVATLAEQLTTARLIGATAVVVHPGSRGERPLAWGLGRVADGVTAALAEAGGGCSIWLENTAGGGGNLGGTLSQLAAMLNLLDGLPCGACLDTAHAWAAGYRLDSRAGARRFLDNVQRVLGLERVGLWHFNDMSMARGCGRDVHAHLGRGLIGREGFAGLVGDRRMASAAVVMETPKDSRWADRRNVAFLRRLESVQAQDGLLTLTA